MPAPAPNSPGILCAAILAEGRRQSDEIWQRAKAGADAMLAGALAEAGEIRRTRREQAQIEAAQRTAMTLASVAVEAGRLRAARVEALLESVRNEIRRRLQARDYDAGETVAALAAQAIRRMAGTDFVLKISAADHAAFGGRLAGDIARRAGRSPLNLAVSADPEVEDGVLIESADGFQIWDNRLASRLDRLWPELRRQIAVQGALGVAGKAAEDCRSPKPGGHSGAPGEGGA